MKRICVFCGSSPGSGPDYMLAARQLGLTLAARKLTLVYGGSSVGLMGQVANACLEGGGEVVGVITQKLVDMGVAYTQLAQLHVVETMHERKAKMAELADGFIALPGGLGTLEEFFEVVTWAQLGMHTKPCGLLNTNQFYDRMLDFLDLAVDQQFIGGIHRGLILMDENPEVLLDKFAGYQAPHVDKGAWVRHLMEQANLPTKEDVVSQLPNLSMAMLELKTTLKHAEETNEPMGVILFHVDNLRQYYEISTEAGDEAVRLLVRIFKSVLRGSDYLARWRIDDEFVLILPGTTEDVTLQVAHQVCDTVRTASKSWMFQTTIYGGIALFPNNGRTVNDLIEIAEKAMNRAQRRE